MQRKNKIKIEVGFDKLTEKDIREHKNFNNVHADFLNKLNPTYKMLKIIGGGSMAVVVAIATLMFLKNKQGQSEDMSQTKTVNATLVNSSEPFINPPLKGVDIPFESYFFNVEEGAELNYKTGSKIKIQENAFTDKNGNSVSGEIEIRYREFHDPIDFFLSGIPMIYDSGGTKYCFESAGMLEIKGFKNGVPITIKPDKSIKIELASSQQGTQYNLYQLDTIERNWLCKGKDKITLPVADKIEEEKVETTRRNLKEIRNEIAEIKRNKPVKPKEAAVKKYCFNIEADVEEFPELAVYKESLFEVSDENKNFQAGYVDTVWDDAALERSKHGFSYNLTLSKGKESHTFIVYPVFEGEKYEHAVSVYKKKHEEYKLILADRKAEQKRQREEYAQLLGQRKQEQKMFVNVMVCFRSFAIRQWGIWNCDRPIPPFPQGADLMVKYEDTDNNELNIHKIFQIEKNRNVLFMRNVYRDNYRINHISFNPKSENIAWAVQDNKFLIFRNEDFQKINRTSGECTFHMTMVNEQLDTPEKIKAFFNLNDK